MCRTRSAKRSVSTFVCADRPASSKASTSTSVSRRNYGGKIKALVRQIERILSESPDDKTIVFGQWRRLLQNVSAALADYGIEAPLLSDAMSARCQQLDEFRQQPDQRVLLLSSQSQSSGINLDCANHVVIIHPYVPPGVVAASAVSLTESQAFEKQAVGRVHRYPQSKQVHVYRMYTRGSVEEELYTLCGYIR